MKGFIVIESCDDYEQILSLDRGPDKPDGGVLCWAVGKFKRVVFPDRKSARAAITRTHYYAKAFNEPTMPDKQFCRIEQVCSAYD